MTYPPFGSKERLMAFFGDILAECSEDYDPQDVADAFVEELDTWVKYHHNCAKAYELIRESLRKRVC
jgi:predicted HD phosphohydrolase